MAEAIDDAIRKTEASLAKVEAAQGSAVKLHKAELDFLAHAEKARDLLLGALQDKSDKDRTVLLELFGGDCQRIIRLRRALEAPKLSGKNATDKRLADALKACGTVEQVLKEKGLASRLQTAQGIGRGADESHGTPAAPLAAAPSSAPSPVSSPAPASLPHKAASAFLSADSAKAGLEAPDSAKCFVAREGGVFAEEVLQLKRDVSVDISCQLNPSFDYGENGTFVMKLQGFTVRLETVVTPALPDVDGLMPFQPLQELYMEAPDELKRVVFDPSSATPAGGQVDAVVQREASILEMPTEIDAKVACRSLSPWGSHKPTWVLR
eukprot:gnl/TRDRNA2_/TRDRNA2_88102_c0_seq3.p1 gnl/TRDRNA2_/TRDRNA2_88102_c0~~gnl/TRDRNA2_/TRDRNA2_88102_c0_seq3.p1  ORF type:complete len:323 (-),score=84.49 gnl/TRDRNA2_/TRDRNA2_88102_c0_seq3:11-979(-)